mgnify:CR=1 FL=1
MNGKILIADDNIFMLNVLKRFFENGLWRVYAVKDGEKALSTAVKNNPDIIILDIAMPKMDGRDVLKHLRKNLKTRLTPILMVSGYDNFEKKNTSFNAGADDYIIKPFSFSELRMKVENLYKRNRQAVFSNPLTHLPGAPAIAEEAQKRILSGEKIAYTYIDIDNFKSYNDTYGYVKGDRAILMLSEIIENTRAISPANIFAGHIGGDDFVIISPDKIAEKIAKKIALSFDKKVPSLYNHKDLKRGFIEWMNRKGEKTKLPLMTLSIAIATNASRRISHHAQFADICAQIKSYLKKDKAMRRKSVFLRDRRKSENTLKSDSKRAWVRAKETYFENTYRRE